MNGSIPALVTLAVIAWVLLLTHVHVMPIVRRHNLRNLRTRKTRRAAVARRTNSPGGDAR